MNNIVEKIKNDAIADIIRMYSNVKDKLDRLSCILGNDTSKMYSLKYMYESALENKLYLGRSDYERDTYKDLKAVHNIIDDDIAIYKYILSKNETNDKHITFKESCDYLIKTKCKEAELLYKIKKNMEEENKPIIVDVDFILWNIESPWDIESTIEQYRSGFISKDQMRHWFYYNMNTCNVETVNVDIDGQRYIIQVEQLVDIIDDLPQYINAYMRSDGIPKICQGMEGIVKHRSSKYLIIKPNEEQLSDIPNEYVDMIEYIKSKPYVTVEDINTKWYMNNGASGYRIFLSYLSANSSKLVHESIDIPIGQLIKASTHAKKPVREQTCYFYYNGTIPNGIKVQRSYYNKLV